MATKRFTSFLVPVLAVIAVLYRGLAELQISWLGVEPLLVLGAALAIGAAGGLAAAFRGERVRVLVFRVTAHR